MEKTKKILQRTLLSAVVILSGCGGYADSSKKAVAVLTADKTSLAVGGKVELDASQSEYDSITWSINQTGLDSCGTIDTCSLQMNTPGSFEIGIKTTTDLSTANSSIIIDVIGKAQTKITGVASGTSAGSNHTISTDGGSPPAPVVKTGMLTPLEVWFNNDIEDLALKKTPGLDAASSVAISPDNKNAYVVSYTSNALKVFSRNVVTGALSPLEVWTDAAMSYSSTVRNGLSTVRGVTVSPDGKNVYTASNNDSMVLVFSRNSSTGALTYQQSLSVSGAQQIVISADGKSAYVAEYYGNALTVYSRNTTTGALTSVERWVDGTLNVPTKTVNGLAAAFSVTVTSDGKSVYVAGSSDNAIVSFSRDEATSALTYVEVLLDAQVQGANTIDGLLRPFFVSSSPDGKNIYVAGSDDDAIAVFSRNETTSALTYLEVWKDGTLNLPNKIVDGLDRPYCVTVSPDGQHVYASTGNDNTVTVFSRNSTTGALSYVEVWNDGVDNFGSHIINGLYLSMSVTVSPDNNSVYVTGYGDNAVVVFSRN